MVCQASQLALFLLGTSLGLDAIRVTDLESAVANSTSTAVAIRADGDAQVVMPADYWNHDQAGERCQAARSGRGVRRFFGTIVGAVVAAPIAALTAIGANSLYYYWYLQDPLNTVLFVAAHASSAAAAMATFVTFRGGSAGTHWTVDVLARLFGYDGHKPACCCTSVPNEPFNCALAGNGLGSKATCPEGMTHMADQCEVVTPSLTYSDSTVGGCSCVDVDAGTCDTNKFHKGHAWCTVSSGRGCDAHRFRINKFRHWDYCIIANRSDTLFVSQFGINNVDLGWFRGNPTNVWRFGSYVDQSKALVIANAEVAVGNSSELRSQSACFAGEREETLDGCAQRCVEDGAPVTDESNDVGSPTLVAPCTGFAYNHLTRLCVRLPAEAAGAEFKPYQNNPSLSAGVRDGWQNFKLLPTEERA